MSVYIDDDYNALTGYIWDEYPELHVIVGCYSLTRDATIVINLNGHEFPKFEFNIKALQMISLKSKRKDVILDFIKRLGWHELKIYFEKKDLEKLILETVQEDKPKRKSKI